MNWPAKYSDWYWPQNTSGFSWRMFRNIQLKYVYLLQWNLQDFAHISTNILFWFLQFSTGFQLSIPLLIFKYQKRNHTLIVNANSIVLIDQILRRTIYYLKLSSAKGICTLYFFIFVVHRRLIPYHVISFSQVSLSNSF